jgi:predicted permease
MLQDLVYAVRSLRRSPAFALVAVLTLGLGIGATSSLFGVVYGVLLRSLPFEDPERLVRVYTVSSSEKRRDLDLSPANFMSLREESRAFTDVAVYGEGEMTLTGSGEPRRLAVSQVSAGFFELLGVRPALGRNFLPEENRPGDDRVAILGHGLWQRTFGRDPRILGRAITVDGIPRTVVGVMPPGFAFPEGRDLWIPRAYTQSFSASSATGRGGGWLATIGRLRPGTSQVEAEAELRAVGHRLQEAFPKSNTGVSFTIVPLRDQMVGEVRTPLLLLLGAVGLVLLIVCANVAGLLLARAATRQGEIAIRAAIGASRGRLLRQLLTESVVLSMLGGAVGLLVAAWSTEALAAARPEALPRWQDVRVDWVVLTFAVGLTLAVGFLVGLVPAIRATRGALAESLRQVGRGGAAMRSASRWRDGLVVAELALAVVLLSGAGLLLRSLLNLTGVDPGFRADRVLSFAVELPGSSYRTDQSIRSLYERLTERLAAVPGTESVGAVSRLPLSGRLNTSFDVVGQRARAPGEEQYIETRSATPEYFRAMGIPLLRGRGIEEGDREGTIPVAVISESAAGRHFGGADPVGQRIRVSTLEAPRTIVGVVGDVRHLGLDRDPAPHVYFPLAQVPRRSMHVIVRTVTDPRTLAGPIRAELRALDPALSAAEFRPLEGIVAESLARPRFVSTLLGLFAVVALALAALGLFGLLSYAVAQRTREIGIRIALGARAGEVLQMILRRALRLAAAGIGLGLVGALALTRFVSGVLYGVEPTDPVTLVTVVALLGGTVLAASLIPARRAASVDPVVALRQE